jgi:3-deoxy-7-phosphoheptulonate synthase
MISRSDRIRAARRAHSSAAPRAAAPVRSASRATPTEIPGGKTAPPFRLATREYHSESTVVRAGGVAIGAGLIVIAGPCSVESRRQILETARSVKAAGANMLRGGAYKPRTSPYDFQGLGAKALGWLAEAREETGLPIVTEVLSQEDVERVAEHADLIQVGARNMQNTALLRKLARTKKPILLKRGPSATIAEWLLAAEYLLAGGNPNVVLCERGIRTFETATRNTLDLAGVALVKQLSHLPVIVDPSHATGLSSLVPAASRAAVAVGADGLLIEVHPRPAEAWSDGAQSLEPGAFAALIQELRAWPVRANASA